MYIDDNFVTYGTALDPLDTENLPRKKPVTIEDQFAYDDQGRRRFHGAFTGGFSAGYFNTVGTRDGWKPQQFKSTRINKAESIVQHPINFMDEEDTGEFGFAPTTIQTTQEYSNPKSKSTKREHSKQYSSGPIPGTPVLRELLEPVRDRIGVILLKKMGWKPGQGIGPRLTKHEKKQKLRKKLDKYTCPSGSQQIKISDSEPSSEDEYANITFAPDDEDPFSCTAKDNYFGIGYSGLNRRPILAEHTNFFEAPTFSLQEKNKTFSIRGQAFGVGAFETEDDDIYHKEDMSLYDFALGPQEKSKSSSLQKEVQKPTCLEGFVLSKEQYIPFKIFKLPELPLNFQPKHKVRKSRFSPLVPENQPVRKRYEMNAETRAKIINDDRPNIISGKKVDSSSSSTAVNLITRTLNLHSRDNKFGKEKLEQMNTAKKASMSWLDKLSSTTFIKGEVIGSDMKSKEIIQEDNIKPVNKLDCMKPIFADLDKQKRFKQYQNFSEAERKLKFTSIQPLSMTEWEREQEILEFEKLVKIYDNMNKASVSSCEKVKEKNTIDTGQHLENLSLENRMATAAKMKMFGKLTRMESTWNPTKLVCIRFNVAEPTVEVTIEDKKNKKNKKFSIFDSLAWDKLSNFQKQQHVEPEPVPSTSFDYQCTYKEPDNKIKTTDEEDLIEIDFKHMPEKETDLEDSYKKIFEKDENKIESYKSMAFNDKTELKKLQNHIGNLNVQEKKDLYMSIFLSSSENSESETEVEKNIDDEKLKTTLIGKSVVELNTQPNNSLGKKIFENLDFDNLLKRPNTIDSLNKKINDKEHEVEKINDSKINLIQKEQDSEEKMDDPDLSLNIYGPALPQIPLQSQNYSSQMSIFTNITKKNIESKDFHWVEKSKNKKSKKEKKKHKHKKTSKSKSKKKEKKEKK